MKKKEFETGRSMVEMLGVLAIIGVLSIGGIAGYSMSMRKHRANQIVDALNKYAIIGHGVCQKAFLDGDVLDMQSCTRVIPSYADSGLPPITEIKSFSLSYVGQSSTYPDLEKVDLFMSFFDQQVCKSVASVIGYLSGPCNPHLSTSIHLK